MSTSPTFVAYDIVINLTFGSLVWLAQHSTWYRTEDQQVSCECRSSVPDVFLPIDTFLCEAFPDEDQFIRNCSAQIRCNVYHKHSKANYTSIARRRPLSKCHWCQRGGQMHRTVFFPSIYFFTVPFPCQRTKCAKAITYCAMLIMQCLCQQRPETSLLWRVLWLYFSDRR